MADLGLPDIAAMTDEELRLVADGPLPATAYDKLRFGGVVAEQKRRAQAAEVAAKALEAAAAECPLISEFQAGWLCERAAELRRGG